MKNSTIWSRIMAAIVAIFALYSCMGKVDHSPICNIYYDTFDLPVKEARCSLVVESNVGYDITVKGGTWLGLVGTAAGTVQSLYILEAKDNDESVEKREVTVYICSPSFDDPSNFKHEFKITQAGCGCGKLSEKATANCYLLDSLGFYTFRADVKGNGKTVDGVSLPSSLSPAGAKLLWQSEADMIDSLSFKGSDVLFRVRKNGNALIGATDASGAVIWSWHIWYPKAEAAELKTAAASFMNMNLGAMSNEKGDGVDAYGLLYQWGRKDPFPGTPVPSGGTTSTLPSKVYDMDGREVTIGHLNYASLDANTIAYSIANPTTVISNYAQSKTSWDWLTPAQASNSLWGNPDGAKRGTDGSFVNEGVKTMLDPCPAGWRVPAPSAYASFEKSGMATTYSIAQFNVFDINRDGDISASDYQDGWYFIIGDNYSYFPAAARYDGSYGMLYGSVSGLYGNYWTNTPGADTNGVAGWANALAFMKSGSTCMVSTASLGHRADAFSVRCVKE